MAATLANAFVVTPPKVKVFSSKIGTPSSASSCKTRPVIEPLYFFGGDKNKGSVSEKASADDAAQSFEDFLSLRPPTTAQLKDLAAGRLSVIATTAEDVIRPAADALDDLTGGYALTYADLDPETQETPVGQAFLASNIAYAAAGLALSLQGDMFLGLLTEICSVASFVYHYTQLDKASKNDTVRFALFVDYVFAFTSIFVGLGYILLDGQIPPMEGLISAAFAISFFMLGLTICAEGIAYVVVHSLWHVFSAYCAYLIGNTHLMNTMS